MLSIESKLMYAPGNTKLHHHDSVTEARAYCRRAYTEDERITSWATIIYDPDTYEPLYRYTQPEEEKTR